MIILFIHTRWGQSHKWDVDSNGMANYEGRLITPLELYESFLVDSPMFDVLRVEVCERVDDNGSYRWITLERLD